MTTPILLKRITFVIITTIFCMLLGGLLGGRVFSPHGRTLDGMFDALEGAMLGFFIGGVAAIVAVVKLNPPNLTKANIIALVCLTAELMFLFLANYYQLWD